MIISSKEWSEIDDDKKKFKNLMHDQGFGWVKKYIKSPENFAEIVSKYSLNFSTDASRRGNRFETSFIKNIDVRFDEIPLHSESSFSPNCPEIIWFYCVNSPTFKNESTMVCDGFKVWNKLSNSTKNLFLKNPIEYSLEIDLGSDTKDRDCFINRIGCGNAQVINNKLIFTSFRYAVNELINSKGKVLLGLCKSFFCCSME